MKAAFAVLAGLLVVDGVATNIKIDVGGCKVEKKWIRKYSDALVWEDLEVMIGTFPNYRKAGRLIKTEFMLPKASLNQRKFMEPKWKYLTKSPKSRLENHFSSGSKMGELLKLQITNLISMSNSL